MIDYIVIAVIVLILGSIAAYYFKRKKEGKAIGSGCSGCASCHVKDCHSRQ